MPQTSIFDLPFELRVEILELAAEEDRFHAPDAFRSLPLLDRNKMPPRISDEYADVFFHDRHIVMTAYYPDTGQWCPVSGTAAKRALFARAAFTYIFDRSLASLQRYAQRLCVQRPDLSVGVLKIIVGGSPRWSLWTVSG